MKIELITPSETEYVGSGVKNSDNSKLKEMVCEVCKGTILFQPNLDGFRPRTCSKKCAGEMKWVD